ncbi:uncharacterized protein RAG0_11077 [Rhynchosporium agropyri]|uniref:Uncharacterized protein n=2 Tax=Rhynchosporium TaxID=38037 RepID=A0A1E1L2I6_9HELO|nr:uncharacterized protein RAG0_11077 [Rhynchosporium agropyri]CZT08528.1 uncharacterized protein RCO7_14981 [Rhynchosporium commune]
MTSESLRQVDCFQKSFSILKSLREGDFEYVGGSEERDMKPAMARGIFSILFAESKNVLLDSFPPQINMSR